MDRWTTARQIEENTMPLLPTVRQRHKKYKTLTLWHKTDCQCNNKYYYYYY